MPATRFLALFALFFAPAALAQEPGYGPGYDPALGAPGEQAVEQAPLPPQPEAQPPARQGYVPRRYRDREKPTPVRLPISKAVPATYFSGKWGQVSFNNETDLPKMAKIARDYCNLPATITQSTPDTIMMYVTTEMKEAQVFEQGGTLYVIPVDQVSDGTIRGARELRVLDNNTFTLRYIEDAAHRRYGPNVFVRCGGGKPKKTEEQAQAAPPVLRP